ncbi:MAG: hypothetical protein HZB16_17445 [Armatimonadetes bacterium]|nr:hypothetical protein [Armatimonadota bacterium]
MTRTALVLAAHGSRSYPASLEPLRRHAAALAESGRWSRVTPAFVYGEPTLAQVAQELDDAEVVVVPFFMAEGYFTKTVMPRELGLAERPRWRVTPPLGCAPGLDDVVLRRLRAAVGDTPIASVGLLLVGHGTDRDRRSRDTTFEHAAALARVGLADVRAAFLEEPPLIAPTLAELGGEVVCVVPLFVADALHTIEDIPRELGLVGAPGDWQSPTRVGGRLVHYTAAVGNDPAVAGLLGELASDGQT